jgi:ATP-dependent RNA helicase A
MSGAQRIELNHNLKYGQLVNVKFWMKIFIDFSKTFLLFCVGPKFRQRFLCEVRVNGYPYVGAGNSTNKKDAEKNASRDFVHFLVRSGKVNQAEVPQECNEPATQKQAPSNDSSFNNQQQSGSYGAPQSNLSNFHSPNQLGKAYQPYNQQDFGPQSYMDRAQQQAQMDEAESLDVNAGIHGNWTIENAKSKLNQFMQANKIQGEFKYSSIGPDHNR